MDITDKAATAAADAMAQIIQEATGTSTGDVAGVFFSGPEMETLKNMAARLLEDHQN